MEKARSQEKCKDLYNPSVKESRRRKGAQLQLHYGDGLIPPNIPVVKADDYQHALEILYGLSYTLKFMIKQRKKNPVDYPVMPLEGLWWAKGSQKNSP